MSTQVGGLSVQGPVGVSKSIEDEIHDFWNTFQSMEYELYTTGFPPLDQPQYSRPSLTPDELEGLSINRATGLTTKYVQIGAWQEYAQNKLARIKGMSLQYENEMKAFAAQFRKKLIRDLTAEHEAGGSNKPFKKPSEETIMQELWTEPKYLTMLRDQQKYEQAKYEMEGHVDSLTREMRIVSRHIEVLKLQQEAGREPVGIPGSMRR